MKNIAPLYPYSLETLNPKLDSKASCLALELSICCADNPLITGTPNRSK